MKCTLRQWQQLPKDIKEVIINASVVEGTDAPQPFPIGMNHQFLGYIEEFKKNTPGNHSKTVLCCFTPDTDSRRRKIGQNRKTIEFTLHENGIYNYPFLKGNAFYNALKEHKFIISPEGNGIDCHRHYEAIMMGCIPVVEEDQSMRVLYEGCPVLYTKGYREINERYLNRKYNEMLDKEYDFSRLFMSFYTDEQKQEIKRCGNFWMKKLANREEYYT